MTLQSLYQIENAYLDIIVRLEESLQNDSLTPEEIESLNQELEINAEEFKQKADAFVALIEMKMSESDRLKEKAKRFLEQAKLEEAVAERLKARVSSAMVRYGMEKIDLENARLSFRKSVSVDVSVPVEQLPALYQRTKLVHEADKPALKKYLQLGGNVPGVALVERQNLQIK